ncbi:MAG: hypothetical protein MPEBLZ_04091 [Candidatus Methanoperedens nitroreducens]|uniref:Uncharacterized protein n=1 Tax=Candidatus Methanoperedens nitratireducens TaxID=1392998 RepID=A0A0P8CFL0_9EURY|nr:MAG: hypothetical protein MPEBLZ_04091 [Candidatus Methanoperedens sp. BLZ1]
MSNGNLPTSVGERFIAAIKRRTGSSGLARRVKQDMCNINTIEFFEGR